MKTNLEVLNEISEKLGGQGNATSVTESLNNIANALGDTNPDEIISVSDSLEDILQYAGQGGGGGDSKVHPFLSLKMKQGTITDLNGDPITDINITFVEDLENLIINKNLIAIYRPEEVITSNTDYDALFILPYADFDGEGNMCCWSNITGNYFSYSNYQGGHSIDLSIAFSDMVNCYVNNDYGILMVTDIQSDASATLTISGEEVSFDGN